MTRPLDPARFAALAEAYGAAVARWPEQERAAAMLTAASPEGAAILARAEALDARLDLWRVPPPSPALARRVAAGAARRGTWRRAKLWWSGIGIAAALSGAAAGSMAVAAVSPVDAPSEQATAFGDLPGETAP